MKTNLLVGVVVAVHCVAVGSVLLIQGCGTTTGSLPVEDRLQPIPMPPSDVSHVPAQPAKIQKTQARPRPIDLPSESTQYVIRKGDTLSGIASRYGVRTSDLMAINGITNPNKIFSGQKIVLPGKVDVDKPATVKRIKPVSLPADGSVYVVKSGDSLSVIAAAHGITTDELRQANGLSGDMIRVGQKLALPGGAKPVKQTKAAVVPDAAQGSTVTASVKNAVSVSSDKVVPDAAVSVTPAAKIKEHVVQEGEDLYTIAMTYAVSTSAIKELNNLTSNKIQKGMKLQIPITED